MVSVLIMDEDAPSKTAISDHNKSAGGPQSDSKAKKTAQELHKCLGISCPKEIVLKSFSCVWQKDILVHGKLFLTENWICFYSSILGWETKTSISLTDVTSITKQRTALFFPAILIETADKKYGFGSFKHRDRTYQLLHTIWDNFCRHHPLTGEALRQHLNANGAARHCARPDTSSLCIEGSSDTASLPSCSPSPSCSSTSSPLPPPLRPSPSSLHDDSSYSDAQTSPSGNTSVEGSEAYLDVSSIVGEADSNNGSEGVHAAAIREWVCASSSSDEEEVEEARDSSSSGDGGMWKTSDRQSLSTHNISTRTHSDEKEDLIKSNLQVTCHNKAALRLHSCHEHSHYSQLNWRAVWVWTLDSTWMQSMLDLCNSTHLINSLILLFILGLVLSMVSMFCQLCRLEPTLQPYMVWQPWCAYRIPLKGLPPN